MRARPPCHLPYLSLSASMHPIVRFVVSLSCFVFGACVQTRCASFSQLVSGTKSIVHQHFPHATIHSRESSFAASAKTEPMTAATKYSVFGRPIWQKTVSPRSDGFDLTLRLTGSPVVSDPHFPRLKSASNCKAYFGYAHLRDTKDLVEIGLFYGYDVPDAFYNSLRELIEKQTTP